MDEEAIKRYDEYCRARDVMLFYTDTPERRGRWSTRTSKKRARLESIRHVLSAGRARITGAWARVVIPATLAMRRVPN